VPHNCSHEVVGVGHRIHRARHSPLTLDDGYCDDAESGRRPVTAGAKPTWLGRAATQQLQQVSCQYGVARFSIDVTHASPEFSWGYGYTDGRREVSRPWLPLPGRALLRPLAPSPLTEQLDWMTKGPPQRHHSNSHIT
jgi:hypothetical protein